MAQLKRGALQPFYHVSQERGEGGAGGAWAPAGDQGLRERGGQGFKGSGRGGGKGSKAPGEGRARVQWLRERGGEGSRAQGEGGAGEFKGVRESGFRRGCMGSRRCVFVGGGPVGFMQWFPQLPLLSPIGHRVSGIQGFGDPVFWGFLGLGLPPPPPRLPIPSCWLMCVTGLPPASYPVAG